MLKDLNKLYDELKALEPFSLSFHHDADGIYSAALLLSVFEVSKVTSPPFNEYNTDVAIDLGAPANKDFKGIVIDHHPDHVANPKYTLYWQTYPTGLIIYNALKGRIPDQFKWKVVGSLCGDGQPELTPDEVWDLFPGLLDERGSIGKGQYGKIYASGFPMLYFLSSGINAIAKRGFPMQALEVVNRAKNPLDILDNLEVIDAKDQYKKEEAEIWKGRPKLEIIKNRYYVVRFKPNNASLSIAGTIASALSREKTGKTIIAINELTGKVSIRGIQAKYISNKLNKYGIKAGGHAAYCGANIPPDEDKVEEFIKILRNI